MKQHVFPWIQGLSDPIDAPLKTLAQCESYGMAARVALGMKSGGPWSESWLASRLGISRGYLSRVLNDQQPMPQWMRRPISYATGYRLVEQFHALQTCERPEDGRAQIERIAQQAVRLVGGERRHDDREAA